MVTCNTRGRGNGCQCTRHDNETLLTTSREKLNSHRNERYHEVVKEWACMVEGMLIRINWYYLKLRKKYPSVSHARRYNGVTIELCLLTKERENIDKT